MNIAVYPGSFDPITNGHLDIVKRASVLFDKLIVGVYDRPDKHLLFLPEERAEMARKTVNTIPNVEVACYSGLTIDFARRVKAKAIVRGLRMSSDFEREFEMGMMNRKLAPEVELVCLMASLRYQFLSSSLMKEVARLGGQIEEMVPPHVAVALKAKFAAEIAQLSKK